MTHTNPIGPAIVLAGAVLTSGAFGAERDVQIVEVDFDAAVVTLRNLGAEEQPLSSYRLCTADEDQMLQYTTGGLDGISLAPADELHIHFNNDADVSDPAAVNVASLGGQSAQPLDAGPYGLCLYHATPFSIPDNMTDYVQWTDDLGNPGNDTADARSATAMGAGLWIQVNQWVITAEDTTGIELLDLSGARLHGPADYGLIAGGDPCPGDLDGDGTVGVSDLLAVLADWGCDIDCDGDADGDGVVGVGDLLTVLGAWGDCP